MLVPAHEWGSQAMVECNCNYPHFHVVASNLVFSFQHHRRVVGDLLWMLTWLDVSSCQPRNQKNIHTAEAEVATTSNVNKGFCGQLTSSHLYRAKTQHALLTPSSPREWRIASAQVWQLRQRSKQMPSETTVRAHVATDVGIYRDRWRMLYISAF